MPPTSHRRLRPGRAATAALVTVLTAMVALPTAATAAGVAAGSAPEKQPVAVGTGGAVASVDADATAAGIEILRAGGSAADAVVATAAVLGLTEPFSAGIGGGGFLVYYDAASKRVSTVDGREAAPGRMRADSFREDGAPIPFTEAVTSGLSAGVPGTVSLWHRAMAEHGRLSLARVLAPAIRVAERGFVVDRTLNRQISANAARFADFTSTSALFLPGGKVPAVGSVFRNPDLAATYRLLARQGGGAFYRGALARDIAAAAQHPPLRAGSTRNVRPGLMTTADLARYSAAVQRPTHSRYHGLDVYGMAPPSSGGTTVGEALNILDRFDLKSMSRAQALHHYLEASRLAFADRGRYVGDPAYVRVPVRELLSTGFAAERACLIRPWHALTSPVDPGVPDGSYGGCRPARTTVPRADLEGTNTTHLTVSDRAGNIASMTFTIESLGGNGIVVPGRGFLLNNELTDFNFGPPTPGIPDPNLPAGGKRPRSSMSPTIVLADGKPFLALGSPGGSTIITTVLQVLVNYLDLGMTLPAAIAAPRATQRNGDPGRAEPAFLDSWYGRRLREHFGQQLELIAPPPDFPPEFFDPEIGAVTAIRFRSDGSLLAAAEPSRRGGGAAMVVDQR